MNPSGTHWWAVVLDGVLSSLIGAGVALLVVYLTRRGDTLRERRRTSHLAAESLTRVMNTNVRGLGMGEFEAIQEFMNEVTVQEPVLFQKELSRRIDDFSEELRDLVENDDLRGQIQRQDSAGGLIFPDAFDTSCRVRYDRVMTFCRALALSLAAHRSSSKFPPWPARAPIPLLNFVALAEAVQSSERGGSNPDGAAPTPADRAP